MSTDKKRSAGRPCKRPQEAIVWKSEDRPDGLTLEEAQTKFSISYPTAAKWRQSDIGKAKPGRPPGAKNKQK